MPGLTPACAQSHRDGARPVLEAAALRHRGRAQEHPVPGHAGVRAWSTSPAARSSSTRCSAPRSIRSPTDAGGPAAAASACSCFIIVTFYAGELVWRDASQAARSRRRDAGAQLGAAGRQVGALLAVVPIFGIVGALAGDGFPDHSRATPTFEPACIRFGWLLGAVPVRAHGACSRVAVQVFANNKFARLPGRDPGLRVVSSCWGCSTSTTTSTASAACRSRLLGHERLRPLTSGAVGWFSLYWLLFAGAAAGARRGLLGARHRAVGPRAPRGGRPPRCGARWRGASSRPRWSAWVGARRLDLLQHQRAQRLHAQRRRARRAQRRLREGIRAVRRTCRSRASSTWTPTSTSSRRAAARDPRHLPAGQPTRRRRSTTLHVPCCRSSNWSPSSSRRTRWTSTTSRWATASTELADAAGARARR